MLLMLFLCNSYIFTQTPLPITYNFNTDNNTEGWTGSSVDMSTHDGYLCFNTAHDATLTSRTYTSPSYTFTPSQYGGIIVDINIKNNTDINIKAFGGKKNGGDSTIQIPTHGAFTTVQYKFYITTTKFELIQNAVVSVVTEINSFVISVNPALPVELISFVGNSNNLLSWSTASEKNSDYFLLERSEDGKDWDIINRIKCVGNSTVVINYSIYDYTFEYGVLNYYRLSQVDFDGKIKVYNDNIVCIDNRLKSNKKIIKIVNTIGQDVDISTKGILFIIFDDKSYYKIFNY